MTKQKGKKPTGIIYQNMLFRIIMSSPTEKLLQQPINANENRYEEITKVYNWARSRLCYMTFVKLSIYQTSL